MVSRFSVLENIELIMAVLVDIDYWFPCNDVLHSVKEIVLCSQEQLCLSPPVLMKKHISVLVLD